MSIADLHIHSNYSDGIFTPEEIVNLAFKNRVNIISITDHDTVCGTDEAIQAAKKFEIEVIPGIEFSTILNGEEIHILGYYMDYKSKKLDSILKEVKNHRFNRILKIASKLQENKMQIQSEDILKYSEGDSVGRPHVARALIEKGYVTSIKEAFDKYLSEGKIGYVERFRLESKYVIDLIHELSGIAVIAHPGLIKNYSNITLLVNEGIDGIEAYHTKHNFNVTQNMLAIANQYNLLITGGSDCHGNIENNTTLIGSVVFPIEHIYKLKTQRQI